MSDPSRRESRTRTPVITIDREGRLVRFQELTDEEIQTLREVHARARSGSPDPTAGPCRPPYRLRGPDTASHGCRPIATRSSGQAMTGQAMTGRGLAVRVRRPTGLPRRWLTGCPVAVAPPLGPPSRAVGRSRRRPVAMAPR